MSRKLRNRRMCQFFFFYSTANIHLNVPIGNTKVALNAIALSWVTAQSYSRNEVVVDRYSLPTMDVGPLAVTSPTDCERGKESEFCGSTTTHGMLQRGPLAVPETLYDYIPRDQVSRVIEGPDKKVERLSVAYLSPG